MARQIKTTIAIDGERAYKQALTEINDVLRTHGSNLRRLSSEYRASANSTEALTQKNKLLQTQIEQQKVKIDSLRQAVRESAEKFGEGSKQTNNWQRQLNNAENQLDELNDELKQNEQYLREAQRSTDGAATSIDRYGNKTRAAGSAVNDLAFALMSAGVAMEMKKITAAIYESIDASKEFESAMAGVFKTVEGTPEQLGKITQGIKDMALEVPAGTTEIAAVAEAAGQLGIATDDILDFTRVMIDLGYSTNLTATEAATALARVANITGTAAEDYGRLGATIVDLGNNFATTEREIVEMTNRLAAAGTLAGLTEAEIMALATAMSSVGIEAQAGGTAMSQTLAAIEKAVATGSDKLEEFARIAGMSAEEFAAAWKSKPAEALSAFITGLGNLSSQGESATIVLDKLGLSGIRQSNMLKSLALASEQLDGALATANRAWNENSALTEEASKRYATVESRMQMCGNAANNLKIAIGDALLPALGNLADAGTNAFTWAAEFVEQNPWLVGAISGVVTALALLTGGLTAYAAVARIAKIVTAELGATAMATMSMVTPLVAVLGLVVGLTLTATGELDSASGAASTLANELKNARNEYQELQKAEAARKGSGVVEELNRLIAQEEKSAAAKERILYLVGQLNEQFPELGLTFDDTTGRLNKSAMALEDVGRKMDSSLQRDSQVTRMNQLIDDQARATKVLAEAKAEQAEIEERLAEATDPTTVAALAAELDNSRIAVARLTKECEAGAAEIANLEAAISNYGTASEAAASQQEVLNAILNDFETQAAALVESYNAAYDAAYESISKQIGVFQMMPEVVGVSVDDTISALQSQVDYMYEYADNISIASKMGINDGLLAVLSDGSVESAKILAGIVSGGETKVAELNAAFASVEEGRQAFASSIANLQTETAQKLSELVEDTKSKIGELDLSGDAYSAAASTIAAYIAGLKSGSDELNSVIAGIAGAVRSGLGGGGGGPAAGAGATPAREGLNYVPYDEFPALLHEGEMVLTKQEATVVRAGGSLGGNTVNVYPRTIDRATIDYLYAKFNAEMGAAI